MEKKFKEEKESYDKEINKLKDEMKQLLRNTCVTATHNRKSPKKSTYTQIPFFQNKEDSKIIINKNSSILQFKINPKNSDTNSTNNENSDSMILKNLNDTTTNFDINMNSFSQVDNSEVDVDPNKSNINIINSRIEETTINNDIDDTTVEEDNEESQYSYSHHEEIESSENEDEYSEYSSKSSMPRISRNNQVNIILFIKYLLDFYSILVFN